MIASALKKWVAFGSGVGIEVTGPAESESLNITLAKVRPGGARQIATLVIDAALNQAAATWGVQYARFVRQHGAAHIPAVITLPRRDVIVRQLALPGVADKDLPSAVQFQLDGLHPYPESDAQASWARIPGTASVLIAIARRSVVERYLALFAEAGVKVGALTCSAAAIHSALHMHGEQARAGVLTYAESGSGLGVYGESEARPVFSAYFDLPLDRAVALASAEMRLESSAPLRPLSAVLGFSPEIPYAAAVMSACPRLSLSVNLLPEENRDHSSRAAWIPAVVLGGLVLVLAGALGALPRFEKTQYLKSLEAEIAKVEPAANRSGALDRQIAQASAHIALLADAKKRTKADMDALAELTKILPPPTWVNLLELTPTQVTLAGETAQTAPLLKLLDDSPLFEGSEFAQSPGRTQSGTEAFRIRTKREAGK
jgi:hypothetical protein